MSGHIGVPIANQTIIWWACITDVAYPTENRPNNKVRKSSSGKVDQPGVKNLYHQTLTTKLRISEDTRNMASGSEATTIEKDWQSLKNAVLSSAESALGQKA